MTAPISEYVFLGAVLVGALYLFWTQKLRTDVTAALVMLSLILPWPHPDGEWRSVLTYQEGFSGFGSSAVIMIGAPLLIAIVLTQVIENAAVAIIVAPIAFQVAQALELNPKPIMIALAICVSAGFTTPVAHESTILVQGPGQYQFRHYLLIGSALAVFTWLGATLLTPVIWPLS